MRTRFLLIFISGFLLPCLCFAQPEFKGGAGALSTFLSGHIVYPEFSRQNCIGGTIRVGFKLDKAGKVHNVQVQQGLGIDLDDEAMRIVKMTSGKWVVPADYDGSATLLLPVRFDPDYTRCKGQSQAGISQAIAGYQARQELENAVTNYYKNKYSGKADTAKQGEINLLKKQLGFDDDFITDVLQQAEDKRKQGDTDGACETWQFIRNIGSSRADEFIGRYCNQR